MLFSENSEAPAEGCASHLSLILTMNSFSEHWIPYEGRANVSNLVFQKEIYNGAFGARPYLALLIKEEETQKTCTTKYYLSS